MICADLLLLLKASSTTIPASRNTSCQLLVLQKCLNKTLHLPLAIVWVSEHDRGVQKRHLPNCCIFERTLLLHFPDDV